MIINEKSQTELAGLYFVYRGTTSLEKKGWYGLSHFMEHLFTKRFEDIEDALQNDGIEWNAYTSDDIVLIYFTGLERCLEKYRETIIEKIYNGFNITEEEVEKEIKIVYDEYQNCFIDQVEAHHINYFRKRFGYYGPIGLGEDILNYTLQDCKDFFDLMYAKPDMIINISPRYTLPVDKLEVTDRSSLLKSKWEVSSGAPVEGNWMDTGKTSMLYINTIDKKDYPMVSLINSLLGYGLNSPLYQEIREKRGLVYYFRSYAWNIGDQYLQEFSTITGHDNVGEVDETMRMVLDNRDKYITADRLNIVKNAMMVQHEIKLINRYKNINDIIYPEKKILYRDILPTVTLDKVYQVYDKYFRSENYYLHTDQDIFKK